MTAVKGQFIQLTGAALTISCILVALGLVWAGIIGLYLWVLSQFS